MYYGGDEFSKEIDSAIKTLQVSYDDMCFSTLKQKNNYKIQNISLDEIIKNRVDYFGVVAYANKKKIKLDIKNSLKIDISNDELIRFIDNNISNSIKYSKLDSTIEIKLEKNVLSFKTVSNQIKDAKKIFDRFYREANMKGGYGIGLNIVKEIAKKYGIKIKVKNDEKYVEFVYIFTKGKIV
jgi:signal transduction histidine kinase